jgi:hypothetical protein
VSKTTNSRRALALLLGLALLALALPAAASAAGPELNVDVTHSPSSIPRNDEQMKYLVDVRNDASTNPGVGDTLTCNGVPEEWGGTKFWGGEPRASLSFTYQWLRNGTPIGGASGSIPLGGARPTYVTTGADAGRAIQCLVKGTVEATNPAESMTYAAVSQPAQLVAPVPSPDAPLATELTSRASMSGEATVSNQLTCNPPNDWSGSPTWTFSWLRNGTEIGTGPTYTVDVADEGTQLQCVAKGTAGTGEAPNGAAAIANSLRAVVGSLPAGITASPFNEPFPAAVPQVEFPNSTNGPVKLEFELPPGAETRVFRALGVNSSGQKITWSSCTTTEPLGGVPAKAVCLATESAPPQGAFETVEVRASLGPDAPDLTTVKAAVSGGGSPSASDEDSFEFGSSTPFAVESLEAKAVDAAGSDYTQAGGHPVAASTSFDLTHRIGAEGQLLQVEFLRDVVTDLPAGFTGNPEAAPQLCASIDAVQEDDFNDPRCPRTSIVGHAAVVLGISGNLSGDLEDNFPIYAVEPDFGVPAQFAFYLKAQKTLISLTPRLRAAEGYAVRVEAPAIAKNPTLFGVAATLCGYGTNVQAQLPTQTFHGGAPEVTGCKPQTQAGTEPANPKPFLTNPTECSATPPTTTVAIDSWENRGAVRSDGSPDYSDPKWLREEATSPNITGCEDVPFSPAVDLQPTSHQADSPTGLDVSIEVPTEGLESPTGIAQGYLKKAVVTLPKGMAVNPSAADGLGACTSSQIGMGSNAPVQCPASSKVGSAEIETPILDESLTGSVYLAKQGDNPFKSLLALYLVAESKERGILVKLAGKVEPQADGQLVATFDDNPRAPVSSVALHFNSGNRAPLIAPPKCGTYAIRSELTPWSSSEPIVSLSSFQVTSGPDGSPCPAPSLAPKLRSGVQNPVVASSSPFFTALSREDGTERFSSLSLKLPPGLTGYLKGIPYCPDATLAGIPTAEGTGQSQIDNPSCPAASQVGTVSVGAGAGSSPFYVHTAKAYLAGPYKGAPLSIAVVAPAVAGPFDLGNVVVRNAAKVDPVSAQITVISDPIPTILHGIPIDVRDIRVNVNRDHFILSPTSCAQMSVEATVGGGLGSSAAASDRFQVGECAALGFKPGLSLKLKGSTKRGGNPALTARVTYPKGAYANIKRASVALPHSEFLDQTHIRTICTRVQFAANACPKGSIYGHAEATSPLLDYTLTGNVYLRSSSNPLPDLVVALRGPAFQPLAVDIAGRIDSVNGGIRTTFESLPDAPVSSFVLKMRGGQRGLLENSRDLCTTTNRATSKMDGHNGKAYDSRPKLQAQCGKARKQAKARKRRGR